MEVWDSLEEFLLQNDNEFIHVETEEEYQKEILRIEEQNNLVKKILEGSITEKFKCKRWLPRKIQIVQMRNGRFTVITRFECVCVER